MFGVRRNKSFVQRGGGDDTNDNSSISSTDSIADFIDNTNNNSNWPPKRSASSFHAPTNLQRQRDTHQTHVSHEDSNPVSSRMSVMDLHETISNLKLSVMTQANSSAETMEHFTTLQGAHDTLYKEHVHLQEQMDDAVELLKYLKEEKGNYEDRIVELTSEMDTLRGANQDTVVSMTIENLTKEKMDLESSLKETQGRGAVVSMTIENLTKEKMDLESMLKFTQGRGEEASKQIATLDCKNSELLVKITSLEKVKKAYDLQTRQQLDSKTKLKNIEKERGELLNKVRRLEKAEAAAAEKNEEQAEQKKECEVKLDNMTQQMEEDKASFEKLQGENTSLLKEQESMKEEMDVVKIQMDIIKGDQVQYQSQEYEIKVLNTKLSNSLSHIAQLQREREHKDSQSIGESNSLLEEANDQVRVTKEQLQQLQTVNEDLLQEKKDMALYVEKMEETLMQKDELLESTMAEFEQYKEDMAPQLSSLQEQLENAVEHEKEDMARQLSSLQEQLVNATEHEKEEMTTQLSSLQEELHEKEEMHQRQLSSLQEQMEEQFEHEKEEISQQLSSLQEELHTKEELHQQQLHSLQVQMMEEHQQQQAGENSHSKEANDSGHNELLLENGSLKYKVQDLQDRLEEQSNETMQKEEIHAQLEKDMQERLAKRIAVQLHDQKIAMGAQIREELEAEYHSDQQQQQDKDSALRAQLLQVKEERERWAKEQEETQRKVLNSQAQFEKVREAFKKKLDKEKARSKDWEKANQEQQIVIEKLSDEHQGIISQFQELQQQIQSDKESSDQQSRQQWQDDKASLLQHHVMQLEEMAQREEQYATRIHELQNEMNDLLNEQTTHENEYNQWEDEKETLIQSYNEKSDELRRAMDDLEQMNSENADYLQKIEDHENTIDTLRQEADEYEEWRVQSSVLQIEQKELKNELEKREEQNENQMRQMEQLNIENGDLQRQILTLEQTISDISTDLSSTQDERNKLQDSLQETNELCLEMESKLSQKREKEQTLEEYQRKVQELETLLTEAEAASASAGLAITEKEKDMTTMADMESRHQETVAGLQKHVSDSTSQISKLIDQLSTVSSEKASVVSDISTMKDNGEAQRNKISQLESSIESLSAEGDAANARVTELLSGNESTEQISKLILQLSAVSSEKASAVSSLSTMKDKGEAQRNKITQLESTIEALSAEGDAANARVTEQVAKLIEQLSAVSSEKASVVSSLSTMKDNGEDQRNKITQLESSIESLSAERDAANARVTELLSGNESTEQVLSSLASSAYENEQTIVRLEAEKANVIAYASGLEDIGKDVQVKADILALKLSASTSEVNKLKTQIEAANQQQTEAETKNNAKDSSNNSPNEEKEEANASSNAQNNSTNEDYDTKIQALQSEIDELKETNAQLTTKNTTIQAQNVSVVPQDTGASVYGNLMKDLVEVSSNYKCLQKDHQDELKKMNMKLRDIKDNNVVLEEAIQDIQVEKEDLELENEELASKLTDLTTQAKKMLSNNESLEDAIADQQIEYEDRIAELESQLTEQGEDDVLISLQQKNKAALETIVKLKKGIAMAGQEKSEVNDIGSHNQLKRVEEENLKLRQVIDHLSLEHDAAKEIKSIVLELRAKNMEMTESLRVSEEKNKTVADTIETLKADNDQLRNDIIAQLSDKSTAKMLTTEAHDDRVVPFENGTSNSVEMGEIEAELQHYKSIVSQMASDTNVFDDQLSKLMYTPGPPQRGLFHATASAALRKPPQATTNEGALVTLESHNRDHLNDGAINQGAMMTKTDATEASFYTLPPNPLHHPTDEVEDQMRNLTVENGQLAQRLGGAVAEKEFAMTTLTKLGAKMEELIERNNLLNNTADVKSQYSSRGASYYSREASSNNHYEFRHEHEHKGRDPDAIGEVESNSAYTEMEASDYPTSVIRHDNYPTPRMHHDAPSAYSDTASTIMSYEPSRQLDEPSRQLDEPSRQLEPESVSAIGNRGGGEFLKSRYSGDREGNDQRVNNRNEASSTAGPKSVKVPGGEYFGQLNERGQKYGNGKMKYDNGNVYEGQWNNNKRDGKGITKYASGNVYTGTWKAGKRHGFGVFHINKTGDVYRGNWAQGLKSGPGVYEYADGELDVSYYQDDIRVGDGVRWSASRRRASRLVDGQLVGEEGDMLVEDATKLTKHLGFVV